MDSTDLRVLLAEVRRDVPGARDRLFARLYDELKQRAHWELERAGRRSLNTTAVVHEAYLRLDRVERLEPEDRGHFMRIAARAMRSVLVDRARRRLSDKRGGGRPHVELASVEVGSENAVEDLLALHDALSRLEEEDKRLAGVVDLKFFAGLTTAEIASALQISERTVKRDWRLARAKLHVALGLSDD